MTQPDTTQPPAHHDPDGGMRVRHTPDSPVANMVIGSPEHRELLAQRPRTEGTHNGRDWSVIGPVDPNPDRFYPKVDCHIWGAFAGLAIELGGYGDLEAVDPYSGRRFWLGSAFTRDQDLTIGREEASKLPEPLPTLSLYDAMRRLIDAMEATGFGTTPETTNPDA